MSALHIPVFTSLPATASGLHPQLVAAVRWDYVVGLFSHADIVHKYRLVLDVDTARAICAGYVDAHIMPARHVLAWSKTSWAHKGAAKV